jgi:CxxC motif-containing protein
LIEEKSVFTTLIRIKGSAYFKVIPVKSSEPMDKNLWIECSKALSRVYAGVPVRAGDVICKNILNTGIDILCIRDVSN